MHHGPVERSRSDPSPRSSHTGEVTDRNVLGGPLEPCGTDPMTGFYRDGICTPDVE
jgi:hypothetical protein